MPDLILSKGFKRRLKRKDADLVAAIVECVHRLGDDPRHPGLQTHRVRGTKGVWEAYVDRANRVTFHYEGGTIVMRNHCNHDIIRRGP